MKRLVLLFLILTAMLAVFSVSAVGAQGPAKSYIVISQSHFGLSGAVLEQIRKAGGTITTNMSRMGLVVVTSTNANFDSSIPAARAVVVNHRLPMETPSVVVGPTFSDVVSPPNTGNDDFFFDLEWGHTAVDAVRAWAMGRRGAGALIAVLDTGVDIDHPDLATQVRADLSTSFVPGEDWNPVPGNYFNHGTHVAGTIAAADNGYGVIGIAPDAQIMAVKVLSEDLGGYGLDAWALEGILYAADHGADVINMSFGSGPMDTINGTCDRFYCFTPQDIADLYLAYSYAALYANAKGATVIAAAGNNAFDFAANPQFINVPSDAVGVISVAAIAPQGWALDPVNAVFRIPTSYTNYGANRIDFAAPGGDRGYPGGEDCTVAGVTNDCQVFDMIFSTIPGGWTWARGTSMAAPHLSGVAAQYIGAAGGSLNPAVVEAALRYTADQNPPYGYRDTFFGWGTVDATYSDYHEHGE